MNLIIFDLIILFKKWNWNLIVGSLFKSGKPQSLCSLEIGSTQNSSLPRKQFTPTGKRSQTMKFSLLKLLIQALTTLFIALAIWIPLANYQARDQNPSWLEDYSYLGISVYVVGFVLICCGINSFLNQSPKHRKRGDDIPAVPKRRKRNYYRPTF